MAANDGEPKTDFHAPILSGPANSAKVGTPSHPTEAQKHQAVDNKFAPKTAVRFGSVDSRDSDMLYRVDRLPSKYECKAFCSSSGENRNLVVVKDGIIADVYKGLPDETNNALLATYGLHEQTTTNPVSREVLRLAPLKVLRACRVILSQLTRTEHREEIKAALRSNNFSRRIEVLAGIDFSKLDLPVDTAKSIAFQLGQTNSLIAGVELYTKGSVQDRHPALAPIIARERTALHCINDQRDQLIASLAGVYVRQKGDLNLLMYGNALAIDDWNQFARQCRGMILDVAHERCIFFPMDKFFRFGEGPELARESFPRDMPVEIVEKVDGSMVSLIEHNGVREFSCKGNFDTAQSLKALEISRSLPFHLLDTGRHWHVFEVIYPENRFPKGLSIVDYGHRRDLVLTAMRDRLTNQLLPYADVVKEAQRVGISHPRVFQGSLGDAFDEVDRAGNHLHTEGFVVRAIEEGKYFKLKYPGYKETLALVNEIRSNRFVRYYVSLKPDERQQTLEQFPGDIRQVALQQLAQHADIVNELRDYSARVRAQPVSSIQEFARNVRLQVPEEFQKLVFQENRRLDATLLLERAAADIYDGRSQFPSFTSFE